nr:ankyrin repeat domain-containing protein 50 [Quercus suber]
MFVLTPRNGKQTLPQRCKMIDIQAFPSEILDLTIEHLVKTIGFYKALGLCTVCQAFNTSIMHAICVRQVIDFTHIDYQFYMFRMPPTFRGKVIEVQSRFADRACKNHLTVVAHVNQGLDVLLHEVDKAMIKSRHETVAAAVAWKCSDPIDAKICAQNLLSGAAIAGDLSIFNWVLHSSEATVNGSTPYFENPLVLAAAHGHLEVVRHLLESNVQDVSLPCYQATATDILITSYTQLAFLNDYDILKAMKFQPRSALRAAALNGHDEIVSLLLQPQHQLPKTSPEYFRAALAAVSIGRLDLVQMLFKTIEQDFSDFEWFRKEMIWVAVRYNRKSIVQTLLDMGVHVDSWPEGGGRQYTSTLHLAAIMGHIGMVKFLLQQGANPKCSARGSRQEQPIEGAARRGHTEVVELLIDHGADPALAFERAADGGQVHLLRFLLSRLPDLPHRKWGRVGLAALSHAVGIGNLTTITFLVVEAGVPLQNDRDPSRTSFYSTRRLGPLWAIRHLLALGARGIDEETCAEPPNNSCRRDITLRDHTWDWVSKY